MNQAAVKKETSIEWLMTQLYKKRFIKEVDGNEPIHLMNQAKQMDKKQKAEEYLNGFKDGKEYQVKLDELTFKTK